MASVTIQKWSTTAACGGQVSHIYRTREHYGNKDIDATLADCNEMAGTAEDARTRIRETIAQVDAATPPKRVRADRKTIAELCIMYTCSTGGYERPGCTEVSDSGMCGADAGH